MDEPKGSQASKMKLSLLPSNQSWDNKERIMEGTLERGARLILKPQKHTDEAINFLTKYREGGGWGASEMISGYSYDKFPNINSNYLFATQTSSAKRQFNLAKSRLTPSWVRWDKVLLLVYSLYSCVKLCSGKLND
jgi:hypothetical protein